MKKAIKIFLAFFVFLAFMPCIFAKDTPTPEVLIDGGSKDIYETAGEGSAVFDQATNTLTLNNYSGEAITFSNFYDTTINIILKGNNSIIKVDDEEYNSAIGFERGENVDLNIKGEDSSSLEIDGYYFGINSLCGKLFIENVDLTIKNISYGIDNNADDLISIKDSKISASDITNVVSSHGDLEIDNLVYVSTQIKGTDFSVFGKLNISNSNFTSTNPSTVETGFITCFGDVIIDNSIVIVKDYISAVYSYNLEINNSFLDLDVWSICLSTFNNGTITINNSDLNLTSSEALIALSESEHVVEPIKLINTSLKENLYGAEVEIIGSSGLLYSLFTQTPPASVEDPADLISLFALNAHFIAGNKIEFDANGGEGYMENVYTQGMYTLPENGFTAPSGKRFKGWSLSKDGDIITSLDVDGAKVLYAIWEDDAVNPQTLDNAGFFAITFTASILGIFGATLYLKKKED